MGCAFYIVDVFAQRKYEGNQLAVVLEAGSLGAPEMQRIAREMNFSETTFVVSGEKRAGVFDVRIFTPKRELPFAGHPVLGTAYVIEREITRERRPRIVLNLKAGPIPVTRGEEEGGEDLYWMRQGPAVFGRVLGVDEVCGALGLERSDLVEGLPLQEVSTGLPFIIVPLRSLEALGRIRVADKQYLDLVRGGEAKAMLAFCRGARDPRNHLSVRVFAGYYGVPEDPATGSANGCLAGYLVKYPHFGTSGIDARIEQGYEIGRPSLLWVRAEEAKGGEIAVRVGGRVVPVARGELL